MNDMYSSSVENYAESKRMYPHRELCMGCLIVAKHDTEATILLIEANLIHQVHYISRSMMELAINLYYIFDNEAERNARMERYRRYSDEVLPYKILQLSKKYPDDFKEQITEEQGKAKEKRFKDFSTRYQNSSGKPNTQSWSGMKMDKMISEMRNEEAKKEFQDLYDWVVRWNTFFLHPSWCHLKQSIKDTTQKRRNYQGSIGLMTIIFTSGQKIVLKFLDNFSKGRPDFQAKMTEINKGFRRKSP